jgi:hypothetical protein
MDYTEVHADFSRYILWRSAEQSYRLAVDVMKWGIEHNDSLVQTSMQAFNDLCATSRWLVGTTSR